MSALRIVPGRRQPSIVRMKLLNYRVRNGNGWDQLIINTDYRKYFVLSKLNRRFTMHLEDSIKVKPSIY